MNLSFSDVTFYRKMGRNGVLAMFLMFVLNVPSQAFVPFNPLKRSEISQSDLQSSHNVPSFHQAAAAEQLRSVLRHSRETAAAEANASDVIKKSTFANEALFDAEPEGQPEELTSSSNTRVKRQALIPFPRTGKRSALIPYPRTGKRSALIPYPRTGKRSALIPYPRTGKRSSSDSSPIEDLSSTPDKRSGSGAQDDPMMGSGLGEYVYSDPPMYIGATEDFDRLLRSRGTPGGYIDGASGASDSAGLGDDDLYDMMYMTERYGRPIGPGKRNQMLHRK